jgi:carboxymethylenebutenolidase
MALGSYLAEEIALDCAEGLLTRREALRRLTLLGVSAAGAAVLLAACGSDANEGAAATTTGATTSSPATTTSSPATTSAVQGEEIRFAGPNGELIGVVASSSNAKGGVLVIHENRGLTSHIRSIPPRLAADGYTAMAVDLLSEEGGTASLPSEGDATAALGRAPAPRMIADLRAGLDELARRAPDSKLAVIGFCFGGGMTWQLLAAGEPRLAAAVPFYGPAPDAPDFSGSKSAAVLGIYAGLDTRVNGTRPAVEAALQAAGNVYELRTFEGADHAFFNDTGPRYNAEAATGAYQAMTGWFTNHLSS